MSCVAEEQMVLDDIFRRTGHKFRHLGSIDRNDRQLIQRILPIAREWVVSSSGPIRGALYFEFLTPAAAPYLQDILSWVKTERSPVEREVLTQVLRLIVTRSTASEVWEVFRALDPTDSDPLLLSKLAGYPSVSDEVAERIFAYLRSVEERIRRGELVRGFARGPLHEYSRVKHPKIKRWFQQYLTSSDPDLRMIANRSSGAKLSPPTGCRINGQQPDHSRLILSTEIDSHCLADFLDKLEADQGVEFLSGVLRDEVVGNLQERRWLVCDATS
jgi:hypothetical protein